MSLLRPALLALGLLVAIPALAQVRTPPPAIADQDGDEPQPAPTPEPIRPVEAGRTAASSAGEVGQRRTRDQADGVSPLARIDSRIQNRVQSRIRNRIDRTYDSQANTTSPFAVAEEQARTAGTIPR